MSETESDRNSDDSHHLNQEECGEPLTDKEHDFSHDEPRTSLSEPSHQERQPSPSADLTQDSDPDQDQVGDHAYKDRGWSWMVLLGCCINSFIGLGLQRAFTIIYHELLVHYDGSATATAWVASMYGLLNAVAAPFVGAFCSKFGHRKVALVGGVLSVVGCILTGFSPSIQIVYVTYGLILGTGAIAVSLPGFGLVAIYFHKYKGKAMAMVLISGTVGSAVFPPLVEVLFREYGYRGTMVIMGGIMLQYLVGSSLFRPFQTTVAMQNLKEREMLAIGQMDSGPKNPPGKKRGPRKGGILQLLGVQQLKDPPFLMICVLMMTGMLCFSTIFTFLSGVAQGLGMNVQELAMVMFVSPLINLPLRMASGAVCDIPWVRTNRIHMFYVVALLTAIFGASIAWVQGVVGLGVTLTVYSLFFSICHAQHNTVVSDMYSRQKVTSALGMCRLFIGAGSIIGPALGGALMDHLGSHKYSYTISGAIMLLASVLPLFVSLFSMRRTTETKENRQPQQEHA